jgi:hypothetical protein
VARINYSQICKKHLGLRCSKKSICTVFQLSVVDPDSKYVVEGTWDDRVHGH